MRKYTIGCLFIFCILLLVSACSKRDEPLVVASDSKREDVKTEVDVLQDMKDRLSNVYFPTDVGNLDRIFISYELENDELILNYEYDATEESKQKDTVIPSMFVLDVNNIEDNRKEKLTGNGRYFALDSMEGFIDSKYDQLTYFGEDTEYNDTFLYQFDHLHTEDFFQAVVDSDMQNQVGKIYKNGYDLFNDLFQFDLKEHTFLDVENTNFDIEKISMEYVVDRHDPKKTPLGNTISIRYGYNDYTFVLSMSTIGTRTAPSYRLWKDNGYEYYVEGSYSGERSDEFKVEKEDYNEFTRFITRKITDE